MDQLVRLTKSTHSNEILGEILKKIAFNDTSHCIDKIKSNEMSKRIL